MNILRRAGLTSLPLLVLGTLALTNKPALAQYPSPYEGIDHGGPTDPHPNADAAAAYIDTFGSMLEAETVVNFESAPTGSFSSLTIAPGVTLTGTDRSGANQTIQNQDGYALNQAPIALAANFAYNTTSSGTNYLLASGGNVTFTFASPIQGFGFYYTGDRFSGDLLTFNDGTARTFYLDAPGAGVGFLGITDAGAQIYSLTLHVAPAAQFTTSNNVGIDDLRLIGPAGTAIPEPASCAAFAFGGLGLLGLGLKARTRQNATGILIEPKWD